MNAPKRRADMPPMCDGFDRNPPKHRAELSHDEALLVDVERRIHEVALQVIDRTDRQFTETWRLLGWKTRQVRR